MTISRVNEIFFDFELFEISEKIGVEYRDFLDRYMLFILQCARDENYSIWFDDFNDQIAESPNAHLLFIEEKYLRKKDGHDGWLEVTFFDYLKDEGFDRSIIRRWNNLVGVRKCKYSKESQLSQRIIAMKGIVDFEEMFYEMSLVESPETAWLTLESLVNPNSPWTLEKLLSGKYRPSDD